VGLGLAILGPGILGALGVAEVVRADEPVAPPDEPEHCNQAIPRERILLAAAPEVSGLPEDGGGGPDAGGGRGPGLPAPGPPDPEARTAARAAPQPPAFEPYRGRDCHRYRRRRVCDGPRRVPRPEGPAADRARALGLGERSVASQLLTAAPDAAWVAAAPETRPGLSWPIPLPDAGRVWRGFGAGRRGHSGVDIGASPGTLVRAARAGLVAYSDNGVRGYGNLVILVHDDGTTTWYAHHRANWVFAGQVVARGQVLGEVGETGLAHGPHLHFELRVGGRPRDPSLHLPPPPDR